MFATSTTKYVSFEFFFIKYVNQYLILNSISTKMNISSKVITYNSTLNLTTRVADFFNVFILPPICLESLLFNFISILVIIKIKRQTNDKRNIYTFMLLNEIIDFLLSFINVIIVIMRCGALCSYGYSFELKIYEQWIYLFLGNSLALFGTLIEISISINRLRAFNTEQKKRLLSFKLECFILFILALVINAPVYLVSRSVVLIGVLTTDDSYLYSLQNNEIGRNIYVRILTSVLTLLRGFVLLNVLFIINVLVVIKFKHFVQQKSNITTSSSWSTKLESKITKFVLIVSLFYLIGNVPNSISPILYIIGVDSIVYDYYVIFGNVILFFSHGSFFFVYYFTNRKFKETFLNTINIKRIK